MISPATLPAKLPWSEWLPQQRWYAGRNRELSAARARRSRPAARRPRPGAHRRRIHRRLIGALPGDRRLGFRAGLRVQHRGHHRRRRGSHRLRRPVCLRRAAVSAVADGYVGRASTASDIEVAFTKEPDVELPLESDAHVSDAEQSNTSVIFDRRAIFKVFRRVSDGINPDIELNRVLARAGNPHVARLFGTYEIAAPNRR